MAITIPSGVPWRLIGFGAAAIGIIAAIWFLIIQPRIELSEQKAEAAAIAAARSKAASDAAEIISQAQKDVADEHADIVDEVVIRNQPIIQRETIIRERIVERAAADGDPMVSDGLDAFLKDLAQ